MDVLLALDPLLAGAGLLVGTVVGLTGMGGGAIMTPLLVLLFGVHPLTAISSDLVASLVMKPVGAIVHARRGRIEWPLVRWLVIGSVPAALAGAYLAHHLGGSAEIAARLQLILGVTLLVACVAIVGKAVLTRKRPRTECGEVTIAIPQTLGIGILGGFVVGLTSVGSGSVMMVLLLLLYPRLSAAQLVGTDLIQAIPLVGAAALGHLFFGELDVPLTLSLIAGAVPGVYFGSRVSARAPDTLIRPLLLILLMVTGLKLLGFGSIPILIAAGAGLVAAYANRRLWARRTETPSAHP